MTARDARADGSDRGQELRIALVMTGGVSLCVWMGGVAREVDRLLERESAYGVLLDGLETDPRLDIVAGTSAGGLNGALLATARAFGADVKGLRDLWLRTGSLEDLLQLPGTRAPTSLLRGDGYFLPQVREALGGLAGGRTAGTEPPELFITGTLLYGRPTGVPDDLGTVVKDADHHAEFHFRPKDFGRDGVLDQLALAARCTASFPGAFEPCFVPIGTSGEPSAAHVDMEGVANFAESRWVVDGGVLLNKPIKPALKAIFAKPAEGQVRRVMLYVIPEAAPEPPLEDHFEHPPPFVGTLVAGSFTIPSNQSISAELDAILEQNARVDAIRQRRALAAGLGPGEVEQLAQSVYPGYRAVVADLIATWIVGLVADGAARVRDEAGDTPLWDAPRLRAALVAHLRQMPPSEFPAEGTTADTAAWFTTYDTVTRAGSVLLDTLRVALGLASMQSGDLRGRIAKLRGQVHEVLRQARLRRAEEELTPAGRRALAVNALAELRSGDLAAWAQGAVAECFGTPENWLGSVRELAGLLDPAAALLAEARESAAPAQAGSYRRAERLATGLRAASRDDALRRLFALEVVELAFGDEPPALDQSVELIQVSADGPNGLDGRTRPEEKLDGLQLGHFGAFYEKSWRANDWLWGRVDAATRLTQTLLEPFRLRQLGFTRDEALALVQRAALGDSPPDVLRSRFDASRADMERELQFLAAEKDAVSDAPLPRSLPSCALAVARRIQLEAALEELPELAETVRQDAEEPVGEPWASLPAGVALSPDEAISVFAANQVGRETIAGDAGSRRFTRTTYRAASVLLEILTGPGSGIHAHGVGRFALRPLAAIARVVLRVSLALRRR